MLGEITLPVLHLWHRVPTLQMDLTRFDGKDMNTAEEVRGD